MIYAISGSTLQFLENVKRGIKVSARLAKEGYAVFSPFIDFLFNLVGEEPLTEKEYKDGSMAWLERSDMVYVVKGWENSKGTIAEIARAKELGIEVVYE